MATVTPKSFVDSLIKTNKVVVFSKSYCPYCTKAKEALTTFSLAPGTMEVVEIEDRGDCEQIQDYLKEITGQRSVPRVFIGGKFFGGGDDTAAAVKSGKLEAELRAVNAIA
uniref:Glutaredoxin-1 n=1 Tax=Meloidogyne incognita TaxID=6306 RepID=A0A914LL20_MELIC